MINNYSANGQKTQKLIIKPALNKFSETYALQSAEKTGLLQHLIFSGLAL